MRNLICERDPTRARTKARNVALSVRLKLCVGLQEVVESKHKIVIGRSIRNLQAHPPAQTHYIPSNGREKPGHVRSSFSTESRFAPVTLSRCGLYAMFLCEALAACLCSRRNAPSSAFGAKGVGSNRRILPSSRLRHICSR